MLSRRNILVFIVLIVITLALVFYFTSGFKLNKVLTVKSGDNVTLFYSLSYTNGTLIQSDFNGKPFSFVVGSGSVIKGFNNGVIGMEIGQTKTFTVPPSEGYGNVTSSLIVTVPRKDFGNSSISDGEAVSSSSGQRGIIIAFNSTNVTINFNSPLAGKTLVFKVKIISINKN